MSSIFAPDALSGEIALVTGASRGIGAAIAVALVEHVLPSSELRPARAARMVLLKSSATAGAALY
mgnify:CR=1 FL=1